jgi:hypothetical protein
MQLSAVYHREVHPAHCGESATRLLIAPRAKQGRARTDILKRKKPSGCNQRRKGQTMLNPNANLVVVLKLVPAAA